MQLKLKSSYKKYSTIILIVTIIAIVGFQLYMKYLDYIGTKTWNKINSELEENYPSVPKTDYVNDSISNFYIKTQKLNQIFEKYANHETVNFTNIEKELRDQSIITKPCFSVIHNPTMSKKDSILVNNPNILDSIRKELIKCLFENEAY